MPRFSQVNLAAVAQSMIPDADNSRDIGSSSKAWATLFARGLKSNAADASNAFDLDTTASFSSGTLFRVLNNGSMRFQVAPSGQIQSTGTQAQLTLNNTGTGALTLTNAALTLATAQGFTFTHGASGKFWAFNRRVQCAKGADVISANDLTLGNNGNLFDITGSTQINGIATADWQAGSMVTLQFDDAPTVKHATAAGSGFASLALAGAADFVASAGDTLTLIYDGTVWREIARAVI